MREESEGKVASVVGKTRAEAEAEKAEAIKAAREQAEADTDAAVGQAKADTVAEEEELPQILNEARVRSLCKVGAMHFNGSGDRGGLRTPRSTLSGTI